MQMKIGDYVRTYEGYIAKYIGDNQNEYAAGEHYSFDSAIRDISNYDFEEDNFIWKSELNKYVKIINSSPNIIDLIQVGDYVNGCYVSFKGSDSIKVFWYKDESEWLSEGDIKSIVTKEQFEGMEYKL